MEHSLEHIGRIDYPDRFHIPESEIASGNPPAECRIDKPIVLESHSIRGEQEDPRSGTGVNPVAGNRDVPVPFE